ncbi:MAG: hypothetical protein RQ833_03760 [Sphingomonadaceae bacterium]|nr:hypothetical protein [Sphingomonadaceae bacterium]
MRSLTAALAAILAASAVVPTAAEAITLSSKERARVARAAPRDRAEVRHCLQARKRGRNKGALGGAAAGGAIGALAGGNVGTALLGAGAGALAGQALGKGAGTDKYCDSILARNP